MGLMEHGAAILGVPGFQRFQLGGPKFSQGHSGRRVPAIGLSFDRSGTNVCTRAMLKLASHLALSVGAIAATLAVEPNPAATRGTADYVPNVAALAMPVSSELRELVERFAAD